MSKSTSKSKLAKLKTEKVAMCGNLWVVRVAPETLLQTESGDVVQFRSFGGAYAFARVNKLWGALLEHHADGAIAEAIQVREPEFCGDMCKTKKGAVLCPKCGCIVVGTVGKEAVCTDCETKVLIPAPKEPEADETENKEE